MLQKELNKQAFLNLIANAPLVSIDLIIIDSQNRILLGRRINEPAKGSWFVPGGRIMKGESIDEAFQRISLAEMGTKYLRSEARLLGVFTHLYDNNFFLEEGITTHYVVLAFEIHVDDNFSINANSQHDQFKWFAREDREINGYKLDNQGVHENVIEYFRIPSRMDNDQYQILNSRRDSFNNLVWQTPVLSLTAQAFLFTIILSGSVSVAGRIVAAVLALLAAIMSLQLLSKHRFMENHLAKILHNYEEIKNIYVANGVVRSRKLITRFSSYRLWMFLLWMFLLGSVVSLILIYLKLLT